MIAVATDVAVAQSAEVVGAVDFVPKFTAPIAPGAVVMVFPYASFRYRDAVTDPPTASWVLFSETVDVESERAPEPEFSNAPGVVTRSPKEVTPSTIPEITALFE